MAQKIKVKDNLIRRIHIFTEPQFTKLKELKKETGYSVCELVRMAIDEFLKETK